MNLFGIAIIGITLSMLYKGTFGKRIPAILLVVAVSSLIEVLTLYLMTIVFKTSADTIVSDGTLKLFGIVASKLLCYAVIKFVNIKFTKEITDFEANYWILFAIMFAVTSIAITTFWKMIEEGISLHIRNLAGMSSLGLSVATIIVLILFENSLKQKSLISRKQISEVRLKEQIRHYNDIMMTQEQMKKTKHDLRNHLLSIKAIIQKGKLDDCVMYIDNLLSNVHIDDAYVDTGNTVLDAIIGAKKSEAERQGVRFITNIKIPKELPISPEDECVIFGNALDNAIEAAAQSKNEKYVNIYLAFDKDALICKIVNSCIDGAEHITTKSDTKNHGFGKYSIQEALRKYNCVSRVINEDGKYTLSIVFMGLYEK